MGFFSDLKEDLSQAVNELMPEDEQTGTDEMPAEEAAEVSLDEMLKNIDEIQLPEEEVQQEAEEGSAEFLTEEELAAKEDEELERLLEEEAMAEEAEQADLPEEGLEESAGEKLPEEPAAESGEEPVQDEEMSEDDELQKMLTDLLQESVAAEEEESSPEENVVEESKGAERRMEIGTNREAVDETSVITGGMTITGDITPEGSIDIIGTVNGNIDALGKLNITGHINGNSKASEIYAESAKINGEVVSEGAIKIGASSVIIGNITAASAAIAGAVKGDIDVRGPVILDASAIVMGNIKSKSVQINNGAVIEGMCSQCYADVSPTAFFEEYKNEGSKAKSK